MKAYLLAILVFISACASYQNKVEVARDHLHSGEYGKAAEVLEPLAVKPGGDQMVYLLDWGISLYLAGEHKRSIEAFLSADQLVDFNDYLSVSQETASLLLGQEMVQYKGTSYEKILINVYLALNFLKLGELESAAVEMRKLRLRLQQLAERGEKDYNRSFLAYYLSGLIWEMSGEWDSAIIDYEKAHKLAPDAEILKEDLVRASYRARRMDSYRQYRRKWNVDFDPKELGRVGHVVVLFEQGWISRLRGSSQNHRVPELYPVRSEVQKLKVTLLGESENREVFSETIFDLDQMAHHYMRDITGPLILKRLAGVAVKAVAADQVRQKNEALGNIAWLAMNLSDRADVRHWSTLPKTFQVLRLKLRPGTYQLKVSGVDSSGKDRVSFPLREVQVEAGETHLHSLRAF